MKTNITLLLLACVCIGMAAFGWKFILHPPNEIDIVVDPDNNCQYLAAYSGGITPRLDTNGKHICGPLE